MTKKIAAAYIRVSTGAQAEADKVSIEEQRSACIKLAEQQGFRLLKKNVYSEIVSGAAEVRPEFDRMMDDARSKKFTRLFVWAQDRLSRSDMSTVLNILSDLDDCGVEVWSVQEGDVTDELLAGIRGWMAGQERKRIAARTAPAKRKKRDAGYWVSGTIPYGYVRGPNMTLQQEPNTARIVRQLYEWSLAGHGRIWMARRLNKDHVPPPFLHFKLPGREKVKRISSSDFEGDWQKIETWMGEYNAEWANGVRSCWSEDNIGKLMRKTIYKGEHHSKPMLIEPAPIVDFATWRDAISAMKGRHMKGKNERGPRLLTGMMKCGSCGRSYIYHENGQGHQYYICSGRRNANGCTSKNIRVLDANRAALGHAHEYLNRQIQRGDLFEHLRANSKSKTALLKSELKDVTARITELVRNHEDLEATLVNATKAGLTEEQLPRIVGDIRTTTNEISTLQRRERGLTTEIANRNKRDQVDMEFTETASRHALEIVYDVLGDNEVISNDQCHQILRLLSVELEVGNEKTIAVSLDDSDDALRDVVNYIADQGRSSAELENEVKSRQSIH